MKAWVIDKICDINSIDSPLSLINLEIPEPKDDEVLLKVLACGICHTEIDEIEGRTPPPVLPVIPGHQVIGKIIKINNNNNSFKIGDIVGVGWIYSACGNCEFCKKGLENLCNNFLATGRDKNGGYAEYMIANVNYIYKIPSYLEFYEAAPLLCAGAIGYRALKLTNLKNGENIGLMGFGASAHIVVKILKTLYPDTKIYVFARNKNEQQFAIELGCYWAGDIDSVPPELMNAMIDTTPVWTTIIYSLEKLKPSGRLIINAIRKENIDIQSLLKIDYKNHLWMEKEIKTVANITKNDIKEFFEIVEKIKIKPEIQTYKFEEANKALKEIKNQKIRGAKVLMVSNI